MKGSYRTGDKVRFLNDTGGGVIVRTEGDSLYFVQTEEGFEIPVSARELVPDTAFETTTAQAHEQAAEQASAGVTVHPGRETAEGNGYESDRRGSIASIPENLTGDHRLVLLAGFVPEGGGPVFRASVGFYLINDSDYAAYYMLGMFERGLYQYLSSGMLEPDTKLHIRSFTQSEISRLSGLHMQALCLNRGIYVRKVPVDTILDLNPYNFSKESYYSENEYFDTRALVLPMSGEADKDVPGGLAEGLPVHETVQKDSTVAVFSRPGKNVVSDTMEIDLHADELLEDNRNLSPQAILSLQMKHFHDAMEEAIHARMRKIVIIHGVGQGTLKLQVRKELQDTYPQYAFQDASFREYGFGATMVHLHTIKKQ